MVAATIRINTQKFQQIGALTLHEANNSRTLRLVPKSEGASTT